MPSVCTFVPVRIAVAVCLGLAGSAAWSAPQFALSDESVNTSGTGNLTGAWASFISTPHTSSFSTVASTTIDFHDVTTPAAPGVDGSVKIYKDTTQTITDHTSGYTVDSGGASGHSSSASYVAQWISFEAVVSSTVGANVYFSLGASGGYLPVATPFGTSAPVPTLYFKTGAGGSYSQLSSTTYVSPGSQGYSSYASTSVYVAAGSSVSFSALYYGAGSVSLNSLSLSISGPQYDSFSTSVDRQVVTHDLFKTVVIPALPVPEPESWALMLGGLAVMGFVALRRGRAD
jgi:hypothetical protein